MRSSGRDGRAERGVNAGGPVGPVGPGAAAANGEARSPASARTEIARTKTARTETVRADAALQMRAEVADRGVCIDLQVPAGEVVALLGANGAGKSTALGLASGTLRPSAGTIHIAGQQVAGNGIWVPPHRRGISLLAQEPLLLPHLNVVDNVAFGPRSQGKGRSRAREIATARLDELGIAHLAGRRARELSGGQQQRVALARALAPAPQLLLLDEPLGALDIEAAAQMRQVLRTAVREAGRSAVIVTHDLLDVLALASYVVVLADGQVAERGPAMQVLSRPRSDFAARLAGVNMLPGIWQSRDAITVAQNLVIHGMPDGEGAPGSAAAATFSPRAVAVHREAPGGSPRNTVMVRVAGIEQHGELVRVRGMAPSGVAIAADITPAAVAALDLAVGQDATFAIKAAEVSLYAA